MTSHSITSSMEPQNGSSCSYQGESASQTSYLPYQSATSMAQVRFPGGQPLAYNSASNRGQEIRLQESAATEAHSYEQPTNGYDNHNDQDYYMRSEQCYYPAETARYENELTFEDDHNEATQTTSASDQGSNQVQRTPQQTSAPGYSSSQNAATGHTRQYSETMQIWSGQQYSDEMLRLGLSHSEQRAREYEHARREYEQSISSYQQQQQQYDSTSRRY